MLDAMIVRNFTGLLIISNLFTSNKFTLLSNKLSGVLARNTVHEVAAMRDEIIASHIVNFLFDWLNAAGLANNMSNINGKYDIFKNPTRNPNTPNPMIVASVIGA